MPPTSELFQQAKSYGKNAESEAISEFRAAGWTATPRDISCSDIFVYRGNRSEILEVKREDNYANSPNACVEMVQIDNLNELKPSGLWATEATIMVHSFGECWIAYRSKPLLIAFYLWWRGREGAFNRGKGPFGDNGNEGFLVKKSWLLRQPWADRIAKGRLPTSKLFG